VYDSASNVSKIIVMYNTMCFFCSTLYICYETAFKLASNSRRNGSNAPSIRKESRWGIHGNPPSLKLGRNSGEFWRFPIFSERQLRYVRYMLSLFRLSVCRLAVTLVHPTEAVEIFGNFSSPYDSPGTLVFWCQKSLVGTPHFPLKFAFKMTHPLSKSAISTNIGS